ncbi:hypothetical protein TrLO_g4085 [Triparma laevis f. longispina]|uniref:Uncharacterized protein n=1 Tax=Triparma laevis f. longispina TaxID=1714387 RepID=A0A9W7CI80_9STRA|nr:hypothetical protein TrLO_g4085 [Triparma laevis f. longispina]
MYLRSVVLYNPKDQSKGKPPKFRGSDAMSVLITSGLVDSEIDAGEILEELEKDGLVVPSKGNLKSPKKVGDRKFRFSEEIIRREAGIIEGLNAVDVTGSPAKGSISGYPSPTKAGGEKKVEWDGDVGGEEGSSGKLVKFSVFVLAVGGLLYPEELASLFGGVVGVEGVKLLGAFVLGISVWNVIGKGETGSGTKGMHAHNIKSPTKRGSIDDGSELQTRIRSMSTPEDPKIPNLDIKEVPKMIEKITDVLIPEFTWIDAGRSIIACDNAMRKAGAGHKIVEKCKPLMETEAIQDARKRYPKCLKALGLLDLNDGWKFYKDQNNTKVYSKYDEKGNFWIKVDGIFKGSPTTCASIWKEGDLFKEWFPFVSHSKFFYKESDAEIVFTYGGTNPLGKSESILHGWGCNHMHDLDDGCFLILGGSVKEWRDKPFPKPGFMVTRNWVNDLSILVEPMGVNGAGEEEVRNVLISSLALPKLPQWFMEWVLGKVFINLVAAMSACGKKCDAPGSETPHAVRNRSDKFYAEFLDPRFEYFKTARGMKSEVKRGVGVREGGGGKGENEHK